MIQNLILKNLAQNEEYTRKCIPILKQDFFETKEHRIVFDQIDKYLKEYNKLPTKKSLLIDLSKQEEMKNDEFASRVIGVVKDSFGQDEDDSASDSSSLEWLVNTTEAWCQERAVYNAIIESVNIIDGKDRNRSKHAIPKILQDALAVSLNTYVGHDYIENFKERFELYNRKEDRIPFDIDLLNKITNGGIPDKTLNIILGGTGTGKSLILCHFAAAYLMQSKNVLYITLEMSEERIAERIDANLMNVPINDLSDLPEQIFEDRINTIAEKTQGRLIIKEYPTSGAHTGHFRALLNELKTKKNFIPDVIIIDYLNICTSSRLKSIGGSVNSYTYIKSIAEELRGLAIEFGVPCWSATQTNRQGVNNSDTDLTNTSESFGLPMSSDLFLAAIVTEELQQRGQILFKQLKNRYNDPSYYNKFYVGVDRSRMKLYDLEESAATDAISSPDRKQHTDIIHDSDDADFSQFKF